MMSLTHTAIALCSVSVCLGSADVGVLATAAIASQLPDLDSSTSFVGRALFPVSSFIESRFPHRTITHSFISTGIVAIAALPLCLVNWHYWAAVTIGQFTGWFADSFTRSGVAAFYPSPVRLVIPGNPRARLRSRSPSEYWVLAIATFLAFISINLASAGGITEQFARSFFADASTAAALFQRYGATQVVIVTIEGLHTRTSQAISNQFTVLETNANDLIVQEDLTGKLYKVGTAPDAQINPRRVHTRLGDRLLITAQELVLQDLSISDFVGQIPEQAYVSGSLLLDDLDDLHIANSFEDYDPIRVFGGQVELRNIRPAQLLERLGEFWIVQGKAIVKQRTLAP